MKVQIEVPPQKIADLMITAIEGGINYCAADVEILRGGRRVSYSDPDSYQGIFEVRGIDCEDPDTKWRFTHDKLASVLAKTDQHPVQEFWAENLDAEAADCILQLAAFDDIVYG